MHRLTEHFIRRFGGEIPAGDADTVDQLLTDAEAAVMDMIGRSSVPGQLDGAVVEWALMGYNKRGAEGESSRSEGGISRVFDELPPLMKQRLLNYPRKVGVVYASDGDRQETV